MTTNSHYIIDPETGVDSSSIAGTVVSLRCHRNRRGPYTGGGQLVRHIVPSLLSTSPKLVTRHAAEVVAMAPDLAPQLPAIPMTLTQGASRDERTRYYPAARTRRLAHGVTELVIAWARQSCSDGVTLEFLELDHADPTDRELVAVLLARCNAAEVRLIVQGGPASDELGQVMNLRALPYTGPTTESTDADSYVDSDGTSRDDDALATYAVLAPDRRRGLHDRRAAFLTELGEQGADLGAIPFHLERGTDSTAAAQQLVVVTEECFERGFYAASLDAALRARVLFGTDRPKSYWNMTNKVGACLCYLARAEESIEYFAELRRGTIDPEVHMNTAYMLAMLYTRHLPPQLRDQAQALEWVNTAIAMADRQPDAHRKAFFGAFMRNARALVELRLGDLNAVLSLLREAIQLTDSDLSSDEHLLHRSVLVYNRAQVYAAMGDHDAALVDYDEILRRDPHYGDYYFERAGERRSAGRYVEALEDYADAIRYSPPFHEAHFNRADLLVEVGLEEQALTDLDYALELEPDHIDSLVNRVDLLLNLGEVARARQDVTTGLAIDPENPNLLTALGGFQEEDGDPDGARRSYSRAMESDATFLAARVNRAVLSFEMGQFLDAVADLDAAIEIEDNAFLRSNRALVLQALGEHKRALVDLDEAIDIFRDEDPELLLRRRTSKRALGDETGARADWEAHQDSIHPDAESAQGPEIEEFAARSADSPVTSAN